MAKNSVTFHDGQIFKNGELVGRFSGTRKEVYVILGGTCIARFKYKNPMTCAKHYLRWALARYSAAEVTARCAAEAPGLWAGREGYVSYNRLQAEKIMAELATIPTEAFYG